MGTVLTAIFIAFGLILVIAGLIGCILPILPGPPLSYIALIIISFAKNWEPFGAVFLIVMGGLTFLVSLLDYLIPMAGAKRYGASKMGMWGSVIGLIIGLFAFPPLGMFIGGFIGAVAGELLAGKKREKAMRAGWGVFMGNLIGIGLKFGLCGVMIFFYIRAMI